MVCNASHLSSTPRRRGSHQAAACWPLHGSLTPSVVLTEPPPLLASVAGREYHCPSDCRRRAGCSPALAVNIFRSALRASWRILLRWLVLSHIGIDVPDEWVFGCQCLVPVFIGLYKLYIRISHFSRAPWGRFTCPTGTLCRAFVRFRTAVQLQP